MNWSRRVSPTLVLVLAFGTAGLQAQRPDGRGSPAGGGAQPAGPKPVYPDIKPVLSVEALKDVKIPNTTIVSVTTSFVSGRSEAVTAWRSMMSIEVTAMPSRVHSCSSSTRERP